MEEIQSIKRMITEGDPHEAIRLLEEYVKRQPESGEAWFLLGKAHYKLGEIRLALNSYLRAMELNPDSPARSAYNMAIQILDFYNKDMYNQ